MASVRMIAMQNENIYSFFFSFTFFGRNILKRKIHTTQSTPANDGGIEPSVYHIAHVLWWMRMHQFCSIFIKTYRHIQYLSLSLPFSGSIECFYFWCVNEHENYGMGRRYTGMRRRSEPPVNSHTHTRTKRNNATRKNIIILYIIQFNIHKVPWDWKHLFFLLFSFFLSRNCDGTIHTVTQLR